MKDKTLDMTVGRPLTCLLRYAWPLIAGNLLQQLYNTFDSVIVGNFVGDSALAAVGAGGQIINLLISFFLGASTGAGILIAMYYGANDGRCLRRACDMTMVLSVILGLAVSVIGIAGGRAALVWMGTPADMMAEAVLYLRIYFGGTFFAVVYQMGAGILNAVGNSAKSLVFLGVASILNIALDLVFVGVFHMGIAGAAIATDISQAVSAVLVVWYLAKVDAPYRIFSKNNEKARAADRHMAAHILRLGIPVGIQNAVISFSNVLIQAGVNAYGTSAVAGFTAYMKVDGFDILPIMSLSLAATTFVSTNIGAGKEERVKAGGRDLLAITVIYTGIVSVVMLAFAHPIIGFFSSSPDVIESGVLMTWALAPFYVLLGIIHALCGIIRGRGRTMPPMVILLLGMCVFRIAWMAFAAPLFHSIMGVYITFAVSYFVCLIMLIPYYFAVGRKPLPQEG